MAKRKVYKTYPARKFIILSLFVFLFIGIGYSLINTNLNVGGSVSVNKYIPPVASVTVHGAANDTITYSGTASGTITTDGDGNASTELEPGNYTFTSSVAKSTTDLNNYYTKDFNVSSSDTDLYFYPDGAVIWYGNGYTANSSLYTVSGGVDYSTYKSSSFNVNTPNGDFKYYQTDKVYMKWGSGSEPGYSATVFTNRSIPMSGYSSLKFATYYNECYAYVSGNESYCVGSTEGTSCYDSSDGTTGAAGRVYAPTSKVNGYNSTYANLSRASTKIYSLSVSGNVYPAITTFTSYCSVHSYGSYARVDATISLYAIWRE